MAIQFDDVVTTQYLELVRAFPLVSIRDDAHLEAALGEVDRLLDLPARSAAEEAYLGALTDLVATYESAHVHLPPVSGVEALRYLMAQNGLTQAALAPFFGSPSIISEALSGKRALALAHITRLADYFGLPADVFIASRQGEAGISRDKQG